MIAPYDYGDHPMPDRGRSAIEVNLLENVDEVKLDRTTQRWSLWPPCCDQNV
ncbi:MAG: hypothetical protein IPL07_10515 [Acidimicrobiaceae bacterium]|nr:hypothetical protein [Acidimicrobiaceae bacterium]